MNSTVLKQIVTSQTSTIVRQKAVQLADAVSHVKSKKNAKLQPGGFYKNQKTECNAQDSHCGFSNFLLLYFFLRDTRVG